MYMKSMVDNADLIKEIREAYIDAKFPDHCGIMAAQHMDDWVSDSAELRKLTLELDFNGSWWDVPEDHITGNSLGFNYLDSKGVVFYLPAFMTLALKKPIYSNLSTLIFYLNPPDKSDKELYGYFLNNFSLIIGDKKAACMSFLRALKSLAEELPDGTIDIRNIENAMSHEFWCVYS